MRNGLVMLMIGLLTACSGSGSAARMATQQWQDIVVEVQSQPEPVQPGMNEFLVLATEKRGRPVHDLVISMRIRADEPWRQAIQDGFSGVYRRALSVTASDTDLAVQLHRKRDNAETELHFSLVPPGEQVPSSESK
ncbi:MAG: hypothetical protein HY272_06580 [Gammaproteobacteria bacterium]|nr:hypothetical protein [Gammaproteobacteria bacterium]